MNFENILFSTIINLIVILFFFTCFMSQKPKSRHCKKFDEKVESQEKKMPILTEIEELSLSRIRIACENYLSEKKLRYLKNRLETMVLNLIKKIPGENKNVEM